MHSIFYDKFTGKFSAINFIIILTVAVHALVLFVPQIGSGILFWGGLIPSQVVTGQAWRVLTYAFLHSTHGVFHIAFNMLGLWMFGKEIEQMWGSRKFFEFYFFSAIFAGIFSLMPVIFVPGTFAHINIIGASGAIMALLVVYAYYFPNRQLLFFFVIPMRVKTAVIIYAIISIFGTAGSFGNIAHITHLGGLLAGYMWILIGDRLDMIIRSIIAFFQNSSTKAQTSDYTFANSRQDAKAKSRADTVDKILDKINRQGIGSLTDSERRVLQEASADHRNNR